MLAQGVVASPEMLPPGRCLSMVIVMVTHEFAVARFAHNIVHVRDGRIVKDESVLDRLGAEQVLRNMPPITD